jgi:hypothetical protein
VPLSSNLKFNCCVDSVWLRTELLEKSPQPVCNQNQTQNQKQAIPQLVQEEEVVELAFLLLI